MGISTVLCVGDWGPSGAGALFPLGSDAPGFCVDGICADRFCADGFCAAGFAVTAEVSTLSQPVSCKHSVLRVNKRLYMTTFVSFRRLKVEGGTRSPIFSNMVCTSRYGVHTGSGLGLGPCTDHTHRSSPPCGAPNSDSKQSKRWGAQKSRPLLRGAYDPTRVNGSPCARQTKNPVRAIDYPS